jgi:hypothetical protein
MNIGKFYFLQTFSLKIATRKFETYSFELYKIK